MREKIQREIRLAFDDGAPDRLERLLEIHGWTVAGDSRALQGQGESPVELTAEELRGVWNALNDIQDAYDLEEERQWRDEIERIGGGL